MTVCTRVNGRALQVEGGWNSSDSSTSEDAFEHCWALESWPRSAVTQCVWAPTSGTEQKAWRWIFSSGSETLDFLPVCSSTFDCKQSFSMWWMKSWCPTSGTIGRLLGHESIDFIKELTHWWIHNAGLAIRRWGTWITAGKLLKVVFNPWPVRYSCFFDSWSNSWFPMSLVALLQQTVALRCTPAPAQEKGR